MKSPRELAPKPTERKPRGHGNAVKLVPRVKSNSPLPKGSEQGAELRRQLGAQIRALRDARGLTQEAIADRIELSQKYVSQLECGQRSPSWETLVAIAHDGFEVKLATLMFGIDEELGREAQDVNDLLAGRPKEARHDLLRAMELLLRAGAASK